MTNAAGVANVAFGLGMGGDVGLTKKGLAFNGALSAAALAPGIALLAHARHGTPQDKKKALWEGTGIGVAGMVGQGMMYAHGSGHEKGPFSWGFQHGKAIEEVAKTGESLS